MKTSLHRPLFAALLIFAMLFSTGLASANVMAAPVQDYSRTITAAASGLPEAAGLQAQTSGCFALELKVIGGMGEPPLASEPNCAGGLYQPGTLVTLIAQPAEGFYVHRWQGTDDDTSTELTNRVTMTADHTVGVHYVHGGDPHETVVGGTPGGVAIVPQPPAGLDGVQTVIGADNRTRVTNTTSIPWRRNAFLAITFPWASSTCTGWFAGPDLVITTGHCVYQSELGGWATKIRVVPGKNGSSEPYGSQYAAGIGSVTGWVQDGMPEYDYGYIKLPNGNLGNQVGWYRYGYFSDVHFSSLGNLTLAGYPGDKTYGTLWTDSAPVGLVGFYFSSYTMDTAGGQSGSPVWYQGTDGQYYAVAVHAYANAGGYPCAYGMNCGVRISKWMAENFQAWGAAAPPVTNCTPVSPPANLSPGNNETVTSDPIEFSWEPVANNEGYIIQIGGAQQYFTPTASYQYWGADIDQLDWKVMTNASAGCPGSEFTDWQTIFISTPSPPTNLKASFLTDEDKIALSWDMSEQAKSYEVYRSILSYEIGDLIFTTNELYYYDYEASSSVTYYYRVKSCNDFRCSESYSSQAKGRRPAVPLTFPENFQASEGTNAGSLVLSWDVNLDGTYYELYKSTTAEDYGTLLASPLYYTTSFIDSVAEYDTTYYYRIRTCNTIRCSDLSNFDPGIRRLAIPSSIRASDGTYADKVQITWNSVEQATFYEVYRSETSGELGVLLGSSTASPYNDYTAPADITSYYRVRACTSNGCGNSNYNTGWRAASIPAIPDNVRVNSYESISYISVHWDAPFLATYYEVFRSETPGEFGTKISSPMTDYSRDRAAEWGVAYYYSVKGCNGAGCSDYSTQIMGGLSPGIPFISSVTEGLYTDKVVITWNPKSEANSYQVYRTLSSEEGEELIGVSSTTSFDDTTGLPGRWYGYRIKACFTPFCGAATGYRSGWRRPVPPDVVSASDGTTQNKVLITWSEIQDIVFYKVYRSTSQESIGGRIGSPTTNSFEDLQSVPNTIYYYRILACGDDNACGEFSVYETGWAEPAIPSKPTDVIASDDETGILITWDEISSASSYKIYRSTSTASYGNLVSTTTSTHFSESPTPFVTFYYRVKACNDLGCSDYSDYDSGWSDLSGPWPHGTEGVYFDRVVLTWDSVNFAAHYQIYRSIPNGGGEFELIGDTSATAFDDFTAIPGQGYSYQLKSCIGSQCGSFGNMAWGRRILGSSASISASNGAYDDRITVSWNSVEGALYYKIYTAPYYDVAGELVGTSETNLFEDFMTLPGPTYYYRIQACRHSEAYCGYLSNSYGSGWRSITIPSASASDGTFFDKIRIAWEPIADIGSYKIYRSSIQDQQGELIATVADALYDDTNVPPGFTYYYRVKACNQSYCSTLSPSEPGWRGVAAPAGLSASNDLTTGISLTWEPVADMTSYQVYRTLLPAGSTRLVGTPAGPAFEDTTAIPGYDYSYQVKACYQENCSALSAAASGWRTQPAPAGFGDYDDSAGMLFYEGDWVETSPGVALNSTLHSSGTLGNFAIFFFEGRCVSLHFTADKQHGRMAIYIDDEYISTLSQYLPGTTMPLQTAPLCVEQGVHTLRLVHAAGAVVDIDMVSVVEPVVYEYQYFAPLFP